MRKLLLFFLFAPVIAGAQVLKPSVTWENICNNPAPLPLVGHLSPLPSSLDRPSRWSVGCETLDRDYSDFERYKQFVGETGVGYGRLQSGWAKTEQKKGRYDFSWLDRHVDGLLAQGVHPWLCLCYGNNLYSGHGTDLNAALFPDGPVMDGWLAYVRATVRHYKGKVTMYEVWNEPDHRKARDSYDLYANLFVRTARVIREEDPDAKIAAFGAVSPKNDYLRLALKGIAKQDGMQYMDYLTYHAYWQIPEFVRPAVERLRRDLAAYSTHTRLLQGETGCPGQLEYGHALKNVEWTEYSQAKWDLRQMMNHFAMDIPYSVFTMVDLNYGWMMQSFGLIRMQLDHKPVYKRPKFHAVQHMTALLREGFTPDSSVTVRSACGREIACTGIRKDGVLVGCALWFCDERPGNSLERTRVHLTLEGIPFRDPVYVDMLDGTVRSIPAFKIKGAIDGSTCRLSGLPLWDSPVVLIEKDAIHFN